MSRASDEHLRQLRRTQEKLLGWLKANTENQEALDWLLNAPSEFLACRVKHLFPEPLPGPVPEGMTWNPAPPEHKGCYLVTFLCPRCKTEKTEITEPGGIFTREIYRKYDWPDGYKTPPGSYITPMMCKNELTRRRAEYEEAETMPESAQRYGMKGRLRT